MDPSHIFVGIENERIMEIAHVEGEAWRVCMDFLSFPFLYGGSEFHNNCLSWTWKPVSAEEAVEKARGLTGEAERLKHLVQSGKEEKGKECVLYT